ncbi:CPBP family intramembrane glutamic endopeptidase [Enterococcus lemanii]|jgi:membrane protease YdiL (CAAX protease family)|uniref:CPBP family intramembrane glutamic endopeptidase n=1 Tax=Enterococcus lemanii TaxID=1159752 RepID=A0ABV9MUI2_9ENTE|nr:type II CAAX endopeptidase family protein [Enterococcus lemanii]MBM7708992.1 membrane protease YdiL (CAAX protease family) [Enterococcus lemanii]NLM68111.1 CPBP family intramembrane metalloprotease [Enterococcus sp.]
MSYKKYTFLTLFIYFIAFIAPSFAFTLQQSLMILTVSYIVGAFALIRLYQNQTTLLPFEEEKMAKGRIWILGLVGIFLAIILQNVAMNIEIFFGGSLESENTNEILALVMQQPLVMLAVAIGGPIMEELVFRRAILGAVTRKTNVWIGVVISSLLFALIHQDGHLLLYSSLGAFFSLQYVITGSIWTSIITHVGMNTLVVLANILVQTMDLPVK